MGAERSLQRFFVRALGTTAGAHTYSQTSMLADFVRRLEAIPDSAAAIERARSFYEHSTIDSRHFELSLEELDRRRQSSHWQPILNEVILSLGRRTLQELFSGGSREPGELRPEHCDAFVVVASVYNGFPAPSRELRGALGFRADTLCFDLTGLACGGANHGIHLAQLLLETGRAKSVCVLCVDALGSREQLARHTAPPPVSELVARTHSSDGAAALVLSVEPGASSVFSYGACEHRVHAWTDALDYMVSKTLASGEPYGAVGKDIRTRLLQESSGLLTPEVLSQPICIHPGGIALLRVLVEASPGLAATAEISRATLAANGNMASPTVLWVLSNTLARRAPIEPVLRLVAFGPGVFTTLLTFHDVIRG